MQTLTVAAALLTLLAGGQVSADGTPAGTVINNVAEVTFELDGTTTTQLSNSAAITVVERVDIVLSLQSSQLMVTANDVDQALLFTVSNTGNGSETVLLSFDSNLSGDDFDPLPAVPAIYFDTDGSGTFSVGDAAYNPGTNDPQLLADQSIDVLLVNDIPGTAVNGQIGHSQLTATSATATGNPGDGFPGQGDGGVDAVVGGTGGESTVVGEYLVSDVAMDIIKAVAVADQFGNQDPIPGATLTYTITIEVTTDGTATASAFGDAIPAGTTYTPNSITLNGGVLSDAVDADAGELDISVTPTVVVRLGDLTQVDGVQTVEFQVTID